MALGRRNWTIRQAVGAALVAWVAGACSSSTDAAKQLNPDPPAKMYADADLMLNKGNYEDSAKKFEDLDRDHPYAPEARRAMVMAGYAYYRAKKYPEAVAAARRYTTLHPGTKDAALAHHVVASSYFDEIKDPAHDQSSARKALVELKTLATRYPESPYAKQAENRMRLAEDSIAANEMYVGRYYLKKGQHVAAINRFKVVVAEHQTTQHVEESLMRLTEAYLSLGVAPEAQASAAVLGHNYPDSKWYKSAYALLQKQGLKPEQNSGSWVGQQIKKLVPGSTPAKLPANEPTIAPQPAAPSVPAVRPPAQDIPTASTTRSRPLGLVQSN